MGISHLHSFYIHSYQRFINIIRIMMLKYSILAAILAESTIAQRFKGFEFHGEQVKLRGRAFLIANPPKDVGKYQPVTAAMLNGGYWELMGHVYNSMKGILSQSNYNEDYVCLGDGWLIHNFNQKDSTSNQDWSEMPYFGDKHNGKFAQLCNNDGNCFDSTNDFREQPQFSKHPENCQDTHIWVTNEWAERFDQILTPVEPENTKQEEPEVEPEGPCKDYIFDQADDTLLPGEKLCAPGGKYDLILKNNCQLTLRKEGVETWHSNTAAQIVAAGLDPLDCKFVVSSGRMDLVNVKMSTLLPVLLLTLKEMLQENGQLLWMMKVFLVFIFMKIHQLMLLEVGMLICG